ncbi:MAG: 30S ribosomal protein S13 [Patescibacteria group bacterium]
MPAARIAGVTLPQNKRIEIALTYIFGIGHARAREILSVVHIDPNARTERLTETEVNNLREIIEKKYRVEGELKRDILLNIKRLREINSYRGTRHAKKLPVRGQRTKTNTRTVRGNVRRTMGSGRAKAAEKT